MEEQNATDRREQTSSISIAEAINTGMKTMSSLVEKYTAAVQAAANPHKGEAINGEATSGIEGPSQRK